MSNAIFGTFIELARCNNFSRLDVVADTYPAVTIKKAERCRRAEKGVHRIHVFGEDQPVPKQWKKFLSGGENKESLMAFLSERWRTFKTAQLHGILEMYVTSKEQCHVLSPGTSAGDVVQCNECVELESDHEEADTRLLLHAKHALNTCDSVTIRSPDTDVFIISIAMQQNLGPKDLFLTTGTGTRCRTIRINAVVDALGEKLCQCLPGFHAYSGKNHSSFPLQSVGT